MPHHLATSISLYPESREARVCPADMLAFAAEHTGLTPG